MADAAVSPPDRRTGRTLDATTREHLLALLQDELARAHRDALARGVPADEIAAQLDERIARLRAQLTDLSTDSSDRST